MLITIWPMYFSCQAWSLTSKSVDTSILKFLYPCRAHGPYFSQGLDRGQSLLALNSQCGRCYSDATRKVVREDSRESLKWWWKYHLFVWVSTYSGFIWHGSHLKELCTSVGHLLFLAKVYLLHGGTKRPQKVCLQTTIILPLGRGISTKPFLTSRCCPTAF